MLLAAITSMKMLLSVLSATTRFWLVLVPIWEPIFLQREKEEFWKFSLLLNGVRILGFEVQHPLCVLEAALMFCVQVAANRTAHPSHREGGVMEKHSFCAATVM